MNHRNAIPAKGARWTAMRSALRREGSVSQTPASCSDAGTASRTSTRLVLMRIEKITPATAAALGGAGGRAEEGALMTMLGPLIRVSAADDPCEPHTGTSRRAYTYYLLHSQPASD